MSMWRACLRFGLILFALSVLSGPAPLWARAEIPPDPPYDYQQMAPGADALPLPEASTADSTNLLVNGDMDQFSFYWRPTNHYVAGMWYEWWVQPDVPEFLDGGIDYHNVCYPMPVSGKCYNKPYYNLSQGYIRYNVRGYTAGIYQIVDNLTVCMPYRFEIYNSNEASGYTTKIGVDISGWRLPAETADNKPYNCPPDGKTKCPDPEINGDADFPATMVWSAVRTEREWKPLELTFEAVNPTVTVWTYAKTPPAVSSASSYWDYGSLRAIPYTDRLPDPTNWTPSGFIKDVTTGVVNTTFTLRWNTSQAAMSQVKYRVVVNSKMDTSGGTIIVDPYQVFIPLVGKPSVPFSYTPVDMDPKTQHELTISVPVPQANQTVTVEYMIFARHPQQQACTTEVYGLSEAVIRP